MTPPRVATLELSVTVTVLPSASVTVIAPGEAAGLWAETAPGTRLSAITATRPATRRGVRERTGLLLQPGTTDPGRSRGRDGGASEDGRDRAAEAPFRRALRRAAL